MTDEFKITNPHEVREIPNITLTANDQWSLAIARGLRGSRLRGTVALARFFSAMLGSAPSAHPCRIEPEPVRNPPPPSGSSTHPKLRSSLHRWADIGVRSDVARPTSEADHHWVLAHRRLRLDAAWGRVQARLAKQHLPGWR